MGLSVEQLSYQYEEGFRLNDICLQVASGRVLGILGPNGSGKSTLLECIVGLRKPARGRIRIGDTDARSLTRRQLAQRIGYVAQNHSPAFPFRVLDVVLMGRCPHLAFHQSPSRRDEQLALENLKQLGIGHLAERPYTQVSGGERRLVMIARALTQQADIIILDEPTAYLDFKNRHRVAQTITALARRGAAIVASLHDPEDALECCDEVLLLNNGSTVACGPTGETLTEGNLSRVYGVPISRTDAPRFVINIRWAEAGSDADG